MFKRMTRRCAAAAVAAALLAPDADAQSEIYIPIPIDILPNAVAAGFGALPEYLGSDDYMFGVGPIATLSTPVGRLNVLVNYANLNLLGRSGFRFGPAAIYRFGRSDVSDPVVAKLPEVDDALELGMMFGYEFVDKDMPLRRLALGTDLTWDVTGSRGGGAANFFARGMTPLPWLGGTGIVGVAATAVSEEFSDSFFGISPAASAASGLPTYSPGAGVRDVRISLGVMQSLSFNWHVGVGAMYSRIVGDAADSPMVKQRGSRDQFIVGMGIGYAWGFDN